MLGDRRGTESSERLDPRSQFQNKPKLIRQVAETALETPHRGSERALLGPPRSVKAANPPSAA